MGWAGPKPTNVRRPQPFSQPHHAVPADRGGQIHNALKSAIATAEAAEGVDLAMIQEAKTLLATKPLQTAMARRDVAQLRAAIEVAEGEEDVDGAVVEVSGCGQRTRARRAMRAIRAWPRCDR